MISGFGAFVIVNCVVVGVKILVGVRRRYAVSLSECLRTASRRVDRERCGLVVRNSRHSMQVIGVWQSAVRQRLGSITSISCHRRQAIHLDRFESSSCRAFWRDEIIDIARSPRAAAIMYVHMTTAFHRIRKAMGNASPPFAGVAISKPDGSKCFTCNCNLITAAL